MDKKLFLILLSLPFISVLLTWMVLSQEQKTSKTIEFPRQYDKNVVADSFFNDSTIINFTIAGKPKNKILGEKLFHYPGEQDSEIEQPRVTVFRDTGSPVLINADHGWINADGTRVILKGHTRVRREPSEYNDFSLLETPELTYWTEKDYAETDKPVKITTHTTIATGIGMKAYLNEEHYYLLDNVKARHVPNRTQPINGQ